MVNNLDYKEYRYDYWNKTIFLLVLFSTLGSLVWIIKDMFISNGKSVFNSLLCRGIPGLFLFVYLKFNNKKNFITLALIHLWLSIAGVVVLYSLEEGFITSGNGWLMYACLFFVLNFSTKFIYSIVNFVIYFLFLFVLYKVFPEKLSISMGELFFSYFLLFFAMLITIYHVHILFKNLYNTTKELNDLSYKDVLTKAYNRRIIEKITKNSKLNNNATIFIIDVDRFKKINDLYGHDGGDEALIFSTKIFNKTFRESDVVIRFGGDEFLIICDGYVNVQKMFSRIHNSLSQEENIYKITFSIGTTHAEKGENIFGSIKRADIALYKVKESGRNNILEYESL